MVLVLLISIGVFGVLYLTDTIKLGEAGAGVAFIGVVATILALLK